jgi:hypothetical protein
LFLAKADDSYLKENELTLYDTVVRHCYFGMGKLPEELKPFEKELEDCEHITIIIPRVKNKNGKIIRLLPSFLVEFKRYSVDDIENGIDNKALPLTEASLTTVYHWRIWWKAFKEQVKELIKSLANKQKGWLRELVLKFHNSLPPTFECNTSKSS